MEASNKREGWHKGEAHRPDTFQTEGHLGGPHSPSKRVCRS